MRGVSSARIVLWGVLAFALALAAACGGEEEVASQATPTGPAAAVGPASIR